MSYLNLKPVEFDAMGKRNQQAFKWEGRILLPKYDGCFCMVAFKDGQPAFIMTREGNTVKCMDHIYGELLAMYPWLHQGDNMVLGEAWLPGREFSELSGMFRRQYPQPDMGFAPFDVVGYTMNSDGTPYLHSASPYAVRLGPLEKPDPKVQALHVFKPYPAKCGSKDSAWAYARSLKELGGYDGAVCSDPTAPYVPGAGKAGEFIKLKPLLSYSLECVATEASTGDKTGRATGALVVRFKAGKLLRVATGLSEAEQADLDQFLGKVIEVEAMGMSSKGLLREPRYKGVRDDATPDF